MIVQLIVIISILMLAIFMGMPVSFSLGFTAIAAIFIFLPPLHLLQIGSVALNQGTSINQLVAPLFILMAEFLARGNVAADIFNVLNKYLRKIKGGLAVSSVLACTIFAALCGSSPATAAAIGRISIHEMSKHGYRPDLSAGTVAAAGTLGIMIPPSIPFVMYGIITENSIAKLLIAGIFPGLMLSALMCVYILIVVRLKPKLIRSQEDTTGHIPFEEKAATVAVKAPRVGTAIKELKLIFPAMLLIVLVLGSLYTGLATPTESAGVGAVGAFLVILLLRRFSRSFFTDVLCASAKTSTMILFLVICGMSLSYVVSYLGLAQGIADCIINLHINKYIVIFILYALWYVMGCMMDPGSMIILTIPFIYPTIIGLGFDPIWLGVVSTLCVEIGMITPPVGFNLFIIKSVSDVPMQGIIKGVIPFVVLLTLGLVILTFFPQICLYLPSHM